MAAFEMTKEQQTVLEQAVARGLIRSWKEAYEVGCAALRWQVQELKEEEKAKRETAERAKAEAIARNQFLLFG